VRRHNHIQFCLSTIVLPSIWKLTGECNLIFALSVEMISTSPDSSGILPVIILAKIVRSIFSKLLTQTFHHSLFHRVNDYSCSVFFRICDNYHFRHRSTVWPLAVMVAVNGSSMSTKVLKLAKHTPTYHVLRYLHSFYKLHLILDHWGANLFY
jgi:hypothetical protein